jgi:hypothetical protein
MRTFENFRIDLEGDRQAYDAPGIDINPAVEILETSPGDKPTRRFVFKNRPGHAGQNSFLAMKYRREVSDWISELKVIEEGRIVAQKAIEVNYPLYYRGYHLYQSSLGYDSQTGKMYTVLSVVNNTGLTSVYVGYVFLSLGVVWRFWFIRLRKNKAREAR